MLTLRLAHPTRPRALRGHPWVFANEVAEPPPPGWEGDEAELHDAHGRFLGCGIVNPASQILWRRYSRDRRALDDAFLRESLAAALERRRGETVGRLVWAESDRLPGLVVDRYGNYLVMQCGTRALDRRADRVARLLGELLDPPPLDVVLRHDAPLRRLEGLPLEVRTLSGGPAPVVRCLLAGFEHTIDLGSGQKTGYYLDQRLHHPAIGALAAGGRRVLDLFCHQGAFALHAARAGASRVLAVDSSAAALAAGAATAAAHGLADRVEWREANVFDLLRTPPEGPWDLVILDPPPFAPSHQSLPAARRGYKELHLRALKLLAPGGRLATFSCSYHISGPDLLEIVGEAAHDARRPVQVERFLHQPPDHPVLPGFPESEYLRGLVLSTSP